MFLIIFLPDMHLSDFLCASLDQCNFLGLRRQKSSLISKLNLQNLAIFTAKFSYFSGKIWDLKWQFSAMPGLW